MGFTDSSFKKWFRFEHDFIEFLHGILHGGLSCLQGVVFDSYQRLPDSPRPFAAGLHARTPGGLNPKPSAISPKPPSSTNKP